MLFHDPSLSHLFYRVFAIFPWPSPTSEARQSSFAQNWIAALRSWVTALIKLTNTACDSAEKLETLDGESPPGA
jgi:hypothetical protein